MTGTTLRSRANAAYLASVDPAEVRRSCGITQQTIADALGVTRAAVSFWERAWKSPSGMAGTAYCRVILGLARHLEVPEDRVERAVSEPDAA